MKSRYEHRYAAQKTALGAEGQQRLRNAAVFVAGAGRIGGPAVMNLMAAGVGSVVNADPQVVEPDNLNSFIFRTADLGKPKVLALAESLAGRDDFVYEPLQLSVEASEVDPYIEAADLVLGCANTERGRLTTDEKALRHGKPVIQAAAFDSRDCLAGSVWVHLPGSDAACAGCFLDPQRNWTPAGSLLATVTSALAAIAANMAVCILSGVYTDVFAESSFFTIDLQLYCATQPLWVVRRSGCPVCGRLAEVGRG